jgi:gliding motility-associated-like protein
LATWKTATIVAVAGASVTAAIMATADSGNTYNTEATTITNTATIATTPQSIADSATIAYAPSSAIAASASTATHSHSATPQPKSNSINNGDYNLPKQPTAETTPATTIIDTNIHENTDTMVPVSSAYTATDNMPVVTDTLYIDSLKTTIQQIQSSVNIIVPNLVTPNFDNYNDCWEIIGIEDYYNVHVVIATPKGKIIYESKHYDNSWCPTDIPDGTYFYAINIISHSYHKKGVLEIRSK